MNGLMVKSVSLSLWPVACNEWSHGEECQSVSLANARWRTMNGLMVKCVRVCLWPMAYNEWSDYEECQRLSLANGVK